MTHRKARLTAELKEDHAQMQSMNSYIVKPTIPRYTEEGACINAVRAFEKDI